MTALCGLVTLSPAIAQVVPDATLPVNSRVTPAGNTNVITGGTQAGNNLFHSFEQFSIPTGSQAHFDNSLGIQNVISRVTGGSISNIDGLIRANGTANLFLLNPNGIIFGPNASLDIGGSFLASTASSMKFADGTEFSATNPQSSPLLTISVPIGLQFGEKLGNILVQGNNQGSGVTSELIDTNFGLRVQPNKTLALVGGSVALESGTLKTAGGRIELGSVAGSGLVNLTSVDSGWALRYTSVPNFGDIQLSGAASVDASGEGSGDIHVWGRRVTLQDGSQIETSTLGFEPGGILSVIAKESVEVLGGSRLLVQTEGAGVAGDLKIETARLIIQDGSQVSASTLSTGQGGTLNVTASDYVKLIGTDAQSFPSGLFSETQGVGDAGDVTITTGKLIVQNGAQVSAGTGIFSEGKGGTLGVTASDSVEVSETSADSEFASGLFTQTQGSGAAGDLTITTGKLIVQDRAEVSSGTTSAGKAGNLIIRTFDLVEVSKDAGIAAQVEQNATGTGGNLTIETARLIVRDGGQVGAGSFGEGSGGSLAVNAFDLVELIGISPNDSLPSGLFVSTIGSGDAGNLNIVTKKLIVRDGAQVGAATFGEGSGGALSVSASESVELIGTNPSGPGSSGLFAFTTGTGAAGSLKIVTEQLVARDGAVLAANSLGQAKGGDIWVNASNSVNLYGVGSNGESSGLFVSAFGAGSGGNIRVDTSAFQVANGAVVDARTIATGNGGNITVNANTFVARNGGQVLSATRSFGNAGNINLNIVDSITLFGSDPTYYSRLSRFGEGTVSNLSPASGLFANTSENSTGSGGSLNITTRQLIVQDSGEVSVSSLGSANAGLLTVEADNLVLDNQGKLQAATASGEGGNINLQVNNLVLMRQNSLISTQAGNNGNGGNIKINTPFLVAVPSENSDIIANAFRGNGGKVDITASGIFGIEYRDRLTLNSDINASSNFGIDGVVELNIPNIDINRGLVSLPVVQLDTQVVQACQPGGSQERSEFVITGRGGLPPNPSDVLSNDAVWTDLGSTNQVVKEGLQSSKEASQVTKSKTEQIVEATGWVINDKGQVVLTASVPTDTSGSSELSNTKCSVP